MKFYTRNFPIMSEYPESFDEYCRIMLSIVEVRPFDM